MLLLADDVTVAFWPQVIADVRPPVDRRDHLSARVCAGSPFAAGSGSGSS
jgi:hypothetical protein